MALTDRKLTVPDDFAGYEVSSLDDKPTLSASELKQRFDASMEEVMAPAFNAAIDDLVAVADGASGADQIGCTAVGEGTAETVQGALEELSTDASSGWIPIPVLTYVSATTVTADGNQTELIQKGNLIRFKQGGAYKHNIVGSSASLTPVTYSAGTDKTTISVLAGYVSDSGDSSFAEAAITDAYISHSQSAIGFPDSFLWVPAYTGFSSNPTEEVRYWPLGKSLGFTIYCGGFGTSNQTYFTFTLPIRANGSASNTFFAITVDNSGLQSGKFMVNRNSATANVSKTYATDAFTNSGGKGIYTSFVLPI